MKPVEAQKIQLWNEAEKALFEKSAAAVRNMNADLKSVLA